MSPRVLVLSLAALCPLAAAGCKGARDDTAIPRMGSTAAPTSSPSSAAAPGFPPGWHALTSAEGHFTVQMVDGAQLSRERTDTPLGPVELLTWVGERANRVYFISYVEYPRGPVANAERALDGARDDAVTNIRGQILTEKRITVAGYPGRDLVVDAESEGVAMGVRLRLIMAGARLYTLTVILPGGSLRELEPDAIRYFDSLRLM